MRIVSDNFLRIGLRRSAILAAFALAACGQRGPLYLPKVPPLPPPPGMAAAPADTGADSAMPASTARGTRRAASAGAASGASASNAAASAASASDAAAADATPSDAAQ